jgi:hypothetical protein
MAAEEPATRLETRLRQTSRYTMSTAKRVVASLVASTGRSGSITGNALCRAEPSPKNAVDIFAGQWSSEFPAPYAELTGATTRLFEDGRIAWAEEQFGGMKAMRVLELGPLEGGHTYMLDRLGAAEVTAIEANEGAYLRCLIAKELLGMPSARFLCGDFMPYLRHAVAREDRWDLCLAIGVLYHQQDPVALLGAATRVSDRLLLWTHYYDADSMRDHPKVASAFTSAHEVTTDGFAHTLHRRHYGAAGKLGGYCGGLSNWASWMPRADILRALDHFGFELIGLSEDADHVNGPSLTLAARRRV